MNECMYGWMYYVNMILEQQMDTLKTIYVCMYVYMHSIWLNRIPASSVMIFLTTPLPVSGKEHSARILGPPFLFVCVVVTII